MNSAGTVQNGLDFFFAQDKTETRGAYEGGFGVSTTKTPVTATTPITDTGTLSLNADYAAVTNWTFGADGRYSTQTSVTQAAAIKFNDTGLFLQKKFDLPVHSKNKSEDGEEEEDFTQTLTLKLRGSLGTVGYGTPKQPTLGQQFVGFAEKSSTLSLTWDASDNISAGISATEYAYPYFDVENAYVKIPQVAQLPIAQLLSGLQSSVSLPESELVLFLDWSVSKNWDLTFTETAQKDYITHDLGSTFQIDATWFVNKKWSLTLSLSQIRTAPLPASNGEPGTPATTNHGTGFAVTYKF